MKHKPNLLPTDLKPMPPIGGWQHFLSDGEGYLKTAFGGFARRKEVFSSEILYNLVAMAIEKFIMAALMRHGAMPYNHTMRDLVEAMEQRFPGIMEDIGENLLRLDAFQDICDLDGFSITPPGMEKIPAMLDLAAKMGGLARQITTSHDL